ncbi:MAG: hypothetical protein F4X45_01560 [Chloroflexi bacterium]|nr:hypothetical protein [Chloroflexota bacterium]
MDKNELVTSIESGKRPRGGVGTITNGVLSIGAEHIAVNGTINLTKPRFIPRGFYSSLRKGKIQANDILIVKDGATTGRIAINTRQCLQEAAANEHIFVLRTDPRRVLQEYIFYCLRSPFGQAGIMSDFRGAAQGGISQKFVKNIPIPVLPLDEQRRIVGILNRAAKIERLRKKSQERLREFIPALFIKMFGDPVDNPLGWAKEKLGRVITSGPQNGLYKPRSAYGSGTPILRIDGFYDGNVSNPASWKRLSLDDSTLRKYKLAENDIVINRVNSRPFLGKSAIIPKTHEPTVFESNMMRIQIDTNRLLPQFLIAMLQLESIRSSLCSNAKDAINQSSINQDDVRSVLIIVPPINLQHRCVRTINAVRSMVSTSYAGNKTSLELKTTLMSRLLESVA